MSSQQDYDVIGPWSEIKLDIIRDYAKEYSKILSRQGLLEHIYIDAFAGGGAHISRTSGEMVLGSPLNALLVEPPFKEYHLIDLDKKKTDELKRIIGNDERAFIYNADCNEVLLKQVFPRARYDKFRRALCLLDPYGLHLNWEVIKSAGTMQSVEIWLNFPIHDMNRNVLTKDPTKISESQIKRMNNYWGDESWRGIAYSGDYDLFGHPEKQDNETIAMAFKKRLKDEAKFKYVSDPLPMKNSMGATIYYLFFASQKPVAKKIVDYIINKYRRML